VTGAPTHAERHRVVLKLESIADLSAEERQALLRLPMIVKTVPADHDIVSIGDCPSHCCLLLEGWACRYKMLPDGGRQIMSFHIPGDIPDLQSLHLNRMDHSLGTLVPTKVALIHHRDLHDLVRRFEGISTALWRDTLIDAAIFREWMVGIGRRSAHQRIAHVLCEMATKLRAVGLNDGHTYPWPVTQQEVADALGLTDVHVNRVLRDIRQAGLITMERGAFTALDWEGLKQLGEFEPSYLHIERSIAA
jgi:CRP-like cAMP-binding protein